MITLIIIDNTHYICIEYLIGYTCNNSYYYYICVCIFVCVLVSI